MNLDGLRDEVVKLIAGEEVVVDTSTFQNDMTTFHTRHDVLTLLLHLGYLALVPESPLLQDKADEEEVVAVHTPNREIRGEFRKCIKNNPNYQGVYELIRKANELLEQILSLNAPEVARLFDEAHQEHTSILKYHDENSLSCVISLSLLLTTTDTYTVYRELPAGKGFADLIYLPKKGVHKPALLMELKYDKSVRTALDQIKEQHYPAGLKDYRGELILVGINYSKKTKRHECQLEKISKS